MRGGIAVCLLGCLAACGAELTGPSSNQGEPDAPPDPDAGVFDAPTDAVVLDAWGMPALVQGASNDAIGEDDGSLSSNTRELVFAIQDADGRKDLFIMTRAAGGAFGAPVRLPFNQTAVSDETPRFSADDLTLYFASARAGGPGNLDIYRVTRPAIGGTWSAPALVPGVSTTGVDKWFTPCAVNNTYLTVLDQDIGFGTLGNAPQIETTLSSAATEISPFLSPDCLTVYFASARNGTVKIFTSTRPTLASAWSMPALVEDFNALGGGQEDPWLSPDNRTFLFVSNAAGTKDLYISTR